MVNPIMSTYKQEKSKTEEDNMVICENKTRKKATEVTKRNHTSLNVIPGVIIFLHSKMKGCLLKILLNTGSAVLIRELHQIMSLLSTIQ